MKEIKLTQGKIALVDDDDFDFINQFKWHALKDENTFYAQRGDRIGKKIVITKMHRQILKVTDPKIHVDHRDRDGLNNQKNNLRTSSSSQNQANCKSRTNSSSKYLGVSWSKANRKWKAQLMKNKTKIYLGLFHSEQDAALAYNNAAKKHHGEFANLNIIK